MQFNSIKNFQSSKMLIRKKKREATDWKKITAKYVYDKRLASRM